MNRTDTAEEVVKWWALCSGEPPKREWFSDDLVFNSEVGIVDMAEWRAYMARRAPYEELRLVATASEGPQVAVFGQAFDAVIRMRFGFSFLFFFVGDRIERVLVVHGLGSRSE